MDDGDRLAPIPLARENPVPHLVVDRGFGLLLLRQPRDHATPSLILHEPGEIVIRNINWAGMFALYMKEVRRFMKVQLQTVWAPAITTLMRSPGVRR